MSNWVDALYSKLLLRDVFGKITPGAILLLAIWGTFLEFETIFNFLSENSDWLWLIYLGGSWITGFAIQAFGEATNLIRQHKNDNDKNYLEIRYKSEDCTDIERQQRERFAIIKEASGNGYVAVILSILTLGIDKLIETKILDVLGDLLKNDWHIVILSVLLIWFLRQMHLKMVDKHDDYCEWIVNKTSNKPSKLD